MYCRYCGKILTTADNLDRCYPSCPESLERKTGLITLQPYDYVALVKERDQLKAENKRLREALETLLTEAKLAGDYRIDKAYIEDAEQALNEVTK